MGAEKIEATISRFGRPTDLNEETIKRAWVYLCDGFKDAGEVVPTVAGLACFLGKSRRVMYDWGNRSSEFMHILDGIAVTQENILVNNGLTGAFNAPVTKMMLTKHGYSDKIEQDVTSSDGSMTPKAAISKEDVKEILKGASEKI